MGLFGSDDSNSVASGGFKNVKEFGGNVLERTIDQEAGVVLYMAKDARDTGVDGVGLTAVPLKDTQFDLNNENTNK